MKLLVKDIIKETNDAMSICLKNGNLFKKFKYKPGQFLTISVPIDGVVQKRAYSFSSNPYTDKDLKITIKRVEKGLVSNYVHDHLKVGDKLQVDDPAGTFCVEPKKENQKQYVLFAGGSGVTPMFSIAKSVLTEEPQSKVLLIYANQTMESIIFHEEIKTLSAEYPDAFKIEHIISANKTYQGNYNPGLATQLLIDRIMMKHNIRYQDHEYMICGPFGYMEKIKEILAENGITRDKIKIEVFKSPTVKVTGKNLLSDVTLKHNGEEYNFKVRGDKSILNQAMSHNIVIPYSCRSGMCSTCKGKCVEGEVQMTDGHILPDDEVERGSILTCVTYPLSEKVVIEI
ncbi:ferredoxin--NADP reductase [Hyunsoonleella pacifica]|uniref:Ferredoxin--NADP reductase n=1 Tax=Hyunsoonleella pacifica TaxID=1080224 RepID=A0A4Q9FTM1_9FLAO|nr:ferredoxin--NADP reductase [Hyunsoonleella pacifica]TBN18689.1 ferredoxin--NADP reductase [Hyunsoonleella pacifica]GGD03852.1 phenylacetic acid degradation protein [Hyunsoonleella pacifica]